MARFELDFYKEFELERAELCGLVNRVTSPKGIKRQEASGYTSYHLRTELVGVYDTKDLNKPMVVEPGLYWVMDICKLDGKQTWLHYLFVVDDDGTTYPVFEFIRATDSTWIKEALPIIKRFFAGEELDPIGITEFPHKKRQKASWAVSR